MVGIFLNIFYLMEEVWNTWPPFIKTTKNMNIYHIFSKKHYFIVLHNFSLGNFSVLFQANFSWHQLKITENLLKKNYANHCLNHDNDKLDKFCQEKYALWHELTFTNWINRLEFLTFGFQLASVNFQTFCPFFERNKVFY